MTLQKRLISEYLVFEVATVLTASSVTILQYLLQQNVVLILK